jgi:hypothetical protein
VVFFGVNMPRIYSWERIYKAALEESDPAKRVAAALAAKETILQRARALEHTATRHSINELAYLEKAIECLSKLGVKAPAENTTSPEEGPRAHAKTAGK